MQDAKTRGLDFRLLIHAHGITNHSHFVPEDFRQFLSPQQAHTKWDDIVPAELLLMRYALRDPRVTHLATVSDDTVPVKPLSYIYTELVREPATRMCIDLSSGEVGGQETHAETWWLMTRSDAQLF